MLLREVGYFKELPHGKIDGPSLKESTSNISSKDEEKIVKYLTNGVAFVSSPGIVRDVFDEEKIIGSLSILTDGEWMWPSDLAYYVLNYHVKLPEDFIVHMQYKDWVSPQENEIDFTSIEMPR